MSTALYVLNENVKYRREGFGAVAVHVPSRAAHFYNATGARVLERCASPTSVADIAADVGLNTPGGLAGLISFLKLCEATRILSSEEFRPGASARQYFTSVNEFPVGTFFAPLAVEVETTMKCFRSCTYCAYESGMNAGSPDELSAETWISILDKLEAEGVIYLHFTGGDPLTRSDFPALLEAADERDFIITVSSDLTVLTEAHAALLARARNLYAVQTTLDGATPESADEQRGRGNFARVTKGLRTLQRHGVPVSVGTIVTKANVNEIGAIGRYLEDFDLVGYCIAPLYPAGRGRELPHLVPDNADLANAIRQFRELVLAGTVRPADPAWWAVVDGLAEDELDHLVDDQPYLARQPDRVLRIDAKGNCYSSIKLKEYLHDQVFVGNIRERQLREIWQHAPLLQHLRSLSPEVSRFGNVIDLRKSERLYAPIESPA